MHIATVHDCGRLEQIAGAPEIQWVAPHERVVKCYGCQQDYEVGLFKMEAPADNRFHPWWEVPQGLSYADSVAYWHSQGIDRQHI